MRASRFVGLVAVLVVGVWGCDLTDVTGGGNNAPVADAGDAMAVHVGETASLDGGASQDDDGDVLTYAWSLVEKPDTSNATLQDADTEAPSLVPDVPGTYRVELTVSDPEDSDTDEVVVTASWNMSLSGTMDSDTTLHDRGEPYVVTGDLYIEAAVVIEPGVTIEVQGGRSIWVDGTGSLTAVGTAADSIRFVGSTAQAGHWRGLHFSTKDAANQLSYVVVAHGGMGASSVVVDWDGQLMLTHSTIRDGSSYGLDVEGDGDLPGFASNVFQSLTAGAVLISAENLGSLDVASTYAGAGHVEVDGGTTAGTQTWKAIDAPYVVSSDLYVESAVTVQPGAVFEFEQGLSVWVDGTGSFSAVGTATDTIRFRGGNGVAGHWDGIHFGTLNTANELSYVEVAHGGSAYEANVMVWWDGQLKLTESRLHTSSGYGLVLDGDARIPTFTSNELTGNTLGAMELAPEHVASIDAASTYTGNTSDFIYLNGGSVTAVGAGTWPATDVPYRVTGDLYVDAAVTVAAGAAFAFEQGLSVWVEGTGSLKAVGTAASPITFTGTVETAGFWDGIHFGTLSTDNILDRVDIGYGGNIYDANVYVWWDGNATVTNSVIHHATYGIWVDDGGSLTESGNTFSTVTASVVRN